MFWEIWSQEKLGLQAHPRLQLDADPGSGAGPWYEAQVLGPGGAWEEEAPKGVISWGPIHCRVSWVFA